MVQYSLIRPLNTWFHPMSCWFKNVSNVACPIASFHSETTREPSHLTSHSESLCCIPDAKIVITKEQVSLSFCSDVKMSFHIFVLFSPVVQQRRMWCIPSLNFPHHGQRLSISFSFFFRRFIVAKRSNSNLKMDVLCCPLICFSARSRASQSTMSNIDTFIHDIVLSHDYPVLGFTSD